MGYKWNIELVKEFLELKGYTLFDTTYKDVHKKITFKDNEGYFYHQNISVLKGSLPNKFHKSNPYTIQNIKLWCKLNNKSFELVSKEYESAKVKLEWLCLKENCGEIFKATWDDIHSSGNGCGICSGSQVGLSNCLATKNPELAKEWHPTLNGDLTPYNVTCGCNKDIWWRCSKKSEHIWHTTISSRSIDKRGCPYCSHQLPSKDYNLLVCNPKLASEWNYVKNNKRPEEYCPNSGKHVWWKCSKCCNEWKTSILSRNGYYKTGCPKCNDSKGENKINQFLDLYGINYIPQKKFDKLFGLGRKHLSFDEFLPDYNLLIEYQGEFHDGHRNVSLIQTNDMLLKQQKHDNIKREFAKQNNYNLLEIWYWDFDRIEEILSGVLEIQNKQIC